MNKITDEETKFEELAEKIALEEFNNPPGNHQFSAEYEQNKANLLNNFVAPQKAKGPSLKRFLLAGIVLLVVVPATVYAASELYQWYVKKENYQLTLTLDKEQDKAGGEMVQTDFYALDLGYLPPEMIASTEANKYNYPNNIGRGGLSFRLWKIKESADFEVLFTESYEEKTFNEHQALIVTRSNLDPTDMESFDRQVFMLFAEEGYILQTYVGNDVPEEEIAKIFNQVSLTKTSKEEATSFTDFDEYNQSMAGEELDQTNQVTGLPADSEQIYQIGETSTVDLSLFEKGKFNYRIDSVETYATIKQFELSNFYDYSLERLKEEQILAEDGELIPFEQQPIEAGDGKSSVDKVSSTQMMQAKFVYVTATIENLGEEAIEELYFQNAPILLAKEKNVWLPIYENKDKSALTLEVDYLDNHGEGDSFYQLPTIASKETRVIHFGFFVDEDQLEALFLPVFNYENLENLDRENLAFFDIRQ